MRSKKISKIPKKKRSSIAPQWYSLLVGAMEQAGKRETRDIHGRNVILQKKIHPVRWRGPQSTIPSG